MLFALIVVLMFGFAFLVPKLLSNVTVGTHEDKQYFSKLTDGELQQCFKHYYLELCNICPPKVNLYDNLEENIKEYPSLGVKYHTYFYLNKYDKYLHKSIKIKRFDCGWYDEYSIFRDNYSVMFAEQFIETAREILSKVDKEEIELLSKYNIYYPFTKSFEVDTMKLFKLPK